MTAINIIKFTEQLKNEARFIYHEACGENEFIELLKIIEHFRMFSFFLRLPKINGCFHLQFSHDYID